MRLWVEKLALAAAAFALSAAVPAFAQAPQAIPTGDGYDSRIELAKSSMMGDSAAALTYARQAVELADTVEDSPETARLTARWLEGEALMRLNRADEAERLIGQSLREAQRVAKGSKLHADLLRSQAGLLAMRGEYGQALQSFQDAYAIFERLGESRSEAIVLQNIGSLYSDARDYERVLRYYREANAAFPEDDALALSAHNNTGNALKELGRYDEARAEFEEALEIARRMASPLLEARIMNNIASVLYMAGDLGGASRAAQEGLAVAQAGAPEWAPFLHGVLAQIAFARGNLDAAESALERTFAGQDLTQTSPYFRDFHETAYLTYRREGRFREALEHLAAFNRLDSQARDLSAKANNALLATQFEAANRELEITRLSADAQAKEVELTRAQNRVILLTLGVIFAVLLVAAVLVALRAMNRSRKATEAANEKLTYVTQHDGLTGLFARDHFRETLDLQIARNAASGKTSVLMFCDLDRFKQVNDVFGHRAGDELLNIVSDRFREIVGPSAVIGRLGGDEFAIVLPDIDNESEAGRIADDLIARVSEPCHIDGHDMSVGASVGIALVGSDNVSGSILMTNADLALYESKRRGRGVFTVYRPSMRKTLEDRAQLETDLERALERGEIALSYQPIVNAAREIVCCEALMRWNHPERGQLGPNVFLPIAEDKMMMERLGAWALRTACEDAAAWPDNVMLAVNVSTSQLSSPNFLATVVDAIAASGLPSSRLALEVRESTVLDMDEELDALIGRLRDFGVTFTLDDFGRGYSSLSYIERIPFSHIKIDRDFVHSAASGSQRSAAIVSAIVSLAASLDIGVTAEGIENEAQVEALTALGCRTFQGYHIGRPTREPLPQGSARKVA